jgi:outer membrane protein TolC
MYIYQNLAKGMLIATALVVLFGIASSTFAASLGGQNDSRTDNLSIERAVYLAQKNDPWLVGSQHSQDAIDSMSIAAGTMPDPKVSLGVANIAADSFDFSQEGMTQFKVGVSQMFPRGDTLQLRQQQLKQIGGQYPFMREDRKAKLSVTAVKLWLDVFKAQQSIALIEQNRSLFEQLTDVAQASYSSAVGKTRQQDIVRAQLELTRLDDRLTVLKQNRETSFQKLSQLLSDYRGGDYSNNTNTPQFLSDQNLPAKLPNIAMLNEAYFTSPKEVGIQSLFEVFAKHPVVRALDQKIEASKSNISLAKQKYKPAWGVNMGYGVRDKAPTGQDRADLFSFGINFDIPLFTGNKQDKEVQSAISKSSSVKTEKWLLIRKLNAEFEMHRSDLIRLNERQKLYQQRLLPQMHDQAEASLTAYTNDDGDFSEVVRSRIAELNAAIEALGINVERQKSIVQLNYYFITSATQIISSKSVHLKSISANGANK